MLSRKWQVVRVVENGDYVLDRTWTEGGAWRARAYWATLQRAVGNKAALEVRRV